MWFPGSPILTVRAPKYQNKTVSMGPKKVNSPTDLEKYSEIKFFPVTLNNLLHSKNMSQDSPRLKRFPSPRFPPFDELHLASPPSLWISLFLLKMELHKKKQCILINTLPCEYYGKEHIPRSYNIRPRLL